MKKKKNDYFYISSDDLADHRNDQRNLRYFWQSINNIDPYITNTLSIVSSNLNCPPKPKNIAKWKERRKKNSFQLASKNCRNISFIWLDSNCHNGSRRIINGQVGENWLTVKCMLEMPSTHFCCCYMLG